MTFYYKAYQFAAEELFVKTPKKGKNATHSFRMA
jgi:hypothetical protein